MFVTFILDDSDNVGNYIQEMHEYLDEEIYENKINLNSAKIIEKILDLFLFREDKVSDVALPVQFELKYTLNVKKQQYMQCYAGPILYFEVKTSLQLV